MIRFIFSLFFVVVYVQGAEIANQTSQDLQNMPSIERGEVGIYPVPIVRATKESLKGYGLIVRDFEREEVLISQWPKSGWREVVSGTGYGGGVIEGSFTMIRKGSIEYSKNDAVNRLYITGWYENPSSATEDIQPFNTKRIYTHEANYHPDGGQVFFPKEKSPFVALLALPGDDITPEDFVAFYFDGSFGVQILPGVWHQPMFAVEDKMCFWNKQSSVHACIGVDFIEEFGLYLEIPLEIE